ncbi:alpha/beta fold hydrolase [Nonomuraea sp. NPDC003804]|uniref:thioesterase II family protein n=1 Tax=Nonomuraea sp. NPDC003804 TaxID=3154547 RepID=UPI0033A82AC8
MKTLPESSARWFLGSPPPPEAHVILFCLPNAGGGGTSYAKWRRHLPGSIWAQPVQLPGRENRFTEPPAFEPRDLADALTDYIDRPYALYGHSMGAALAYDLALEMCRRGRPPASLFVGACSPPHLPSAWVRRWATLADDALIDEIAQLGATPLAVLEHPSLRGRLARVLRSDLEWLAAYRASATSELTMPIVGFAGKADPIVEPEGMKHWDELAAGDFRLHVLPGGHLFHIEDPSTLLSLLASDLRGAPR